MFYSEHSKEFILEFQKIISEHRMPLWSEIPDIGLYMDQVIILMNNYLSIYSDPSEDNKIITPSIINNYVKMKIIPAPQKKKYMRSHLAYLLIICCLKQSLSISVIKNIVPITLGLDELEKIYNAFSDNEYAVLKSLSDELVLSLPTQIENENPDFYNMVMQSALSATAFKMLTERLMYSPDTNKKEKK